MIPKVEDMRRETSYFHTNMPENGGSIFEPFASNRTPKFEVDQSRTNTKEEAETKIHRLGMSPTEHNRLLFGNRKYSSEEESLEIEVKNYNSEVT